MSPLPVRRGGWRLVAIALSAGLCTGCGVSAADLPLPAAGIGGPSYRLSAVFDDALNLPDGASVTLNGDRIGRVQEISTQNYTARVDMALRQDVTLPAGSTAELRQATPLGEVFVALHPPERPVPGAALRDGDVIALADTSASATAEDLLTSLSALVNGGGLAQVQTIVEELNAATDGRAAQIAHLLDQTGDTLATLNARTADVDRVLAASERLTLLLRERRGTVDVAFDELTPGIRELADRADRFTRALSAAGDVSDHADQLVRRSEDDVRAIARDLGPVLRGFADTRPLLGTSLRDILTFGEIFEQLTRGESASAQGAVSPFPLISVPRTGDRPPGPDDFVDGQQSFAQHLQNQVSTRGGTR